MADQARSTQAGAERQAPGQAPANEGGLYGHLAQIAAQAQAAELSGAGGGAMEPAVAAAPPPPPPSATAAAGQSDEAHADPAASGTPPAAAPAAPTTRVEHTEFGDFVIYPNDFVGPLPPASAAGESMRESEFTTHIATRRAQLAAQVATVLGEVNGLLSYGVFDWAITDAEALQAVQTLGTLPLEALAGAVGRIDVGRLLDNLPDNALTDPAFPKVVVALGDAGAAYASRLLPGTINFANSDAEWALVAQFIARLDAGMQLVHVVGFGPEGMARLGKNMPAGVRFDDLVLKTMFDLIPDTELTALMVVMSRRFNFEVGTRDGGNWTADGLRRGWAILEQLPPGHVAGNDALDLFLVNNGADGGGYYRGSDDSAVIGYSDITKTGSYGQVRVDDGAGGTTDVGLNSNVNLFDTVVRHEIGHAVDAKMGITNDGGYTSTQAHAGKWKTYANATAFVDDIIAAGGGMEAHGYADHAAYEKAMRRAVSQGENFNIALAALKTAGDVDNAVAEADATTAGPVAAVFTTDRWQSSQSPWYNNADRPAVGGRQFHQAYASKFASFQADARPQYGVSAYQWRAPGEWFAEVYAVYYSDHDSVTGARPGTRLRSRDSATADWFDTTVDGGHSLPAETNQEAGGGGGGGGGGTTSAGDGRASSQAGR
ncbi:MAG: hypothetical protein R3F65_06220 [bacterium]|nr:hypothetical protein [Myxococcales bacterium]